MKIKKLLTVFVGVVLTLSLTGCGFSIGTSGESVTIQMFSQIQ